MATATMAADTGQKAGFWIRAIAYLIDAVILLVVQYILSLVLRDAAGIVSFVVGIAYFVYFWSASGGGMTPGMRVFGLHVIRTDGSALTITQAVIRYVGLIVAAIPFAIGLIWVAFDSNKQGWHDKIASTYVVKR
ncbi:MAG: RDD family protein [Chloroflexi bacterium]|nr:MAG: RDD family protein [Chloroflexota bacterium]TMF60456.1 MAG: RDD family protein [Chloroflexota bacterium]TMG34560.1 MAG: RDD family protein [Chloroflexota bacterium]TMG37707.1 MAG: RDD family protein [Chloroflexota bacterium]